MPRKSRSSEARRPLARLASPEQSKLWPILVEIFNQSQHVATTDAALNQLIKIYKTTKYSTFEIPFKNLFKRLLQSKQTSYFKTSCDFVCKFLKHVSQLSKEPDAENIEPPRVSGKTRRTTRHHVAKRRRKMDDDEDELVLGLTTREDESEDESPRQQTLDSVITNHDRLISTIINVADQYMQVAHENSRTNAVSFVCKFLSHIESLDEEICKALKSALPERIRDRRPFIRAQAVLASRKFQDSKTTQDSFHHHFYYDPEPMVRKALIQIMDTNVFGYDFLVDSTLDSHESIRKIAFQRLGKIDPKLLSQKQLHTIIHNGLIERERQVSYSFRTNTLDVWLNSLYDGLDLYKLLESFDILNNLDDTNRLLELVHERDLEIMENNGAATRLHHVVEFFREKYLDVDGICVPVLDKLDSRATVIWLSLVKFCKVNKASIKSVKIRPVQQVDDPNVSIEKILDSQERQDEVIDLYERLVPDLVNLIDYMRKYVQHAHGILKRDSSREQILELEFVYQKVMEFIGESEIGDELERKTVHENIALILKENLLTGTFDSMIPPLIRVLYRLVYNSNSTTMISYISELINNVRSHLEDLANPALSQSTIVAPKAKTPRANKNRVRFSTQLEGEIADIIYNLEVLRDELDQCIKNNDFESAKTIRAKMSDLEAQRKLKHDHRFGIAVDVSDMSLVLESQDVAEGKLSSTMICDSQDDKENPIIFKHHTDELIKCLQMYLGCLQSVKVSQVPETMTNLLNFLNYQCVDKWFDNDQKVRRLMVECNSVTALVDKGFAQQPENIGLVLAACCKPDLSASIEVRTAGVKGFVDILCQHKDLDIPVETFERILSDFEKFLSNSLKDYGAYELEDMLTPEYKFYQALIVGTTKLYYHRRLDSPEILSHLILWWYHPQTHSWLKQFIGIFLPTFVEDCLKKSLDDNPLEDLLADTFVTSIEYLHEYIRGPGLDIMDASDMQSLIEFLCNLVPIPMLSRVEEKIEEKMDNLPKGNQDLLKYLEKSRTAVSSTIKATNTETAQTPAKALQTPAKNPLTID